MNDWQAFTESVTWFVKAGSDVCIASSRKGYNLSSPTAVLFPQLARLLISADVTAVTVDGSAYELLGWNGLDGNRIGWLCLPAMAQPANELCEEHRKLLVSFGGIVERFNEPEETWLLNLNDALTAREAKNDGTFIEDYADIARHRGLGLTLPIVSKDFYSIAREANGNTTLCHRKNGRVIMFAPDHCFDHVNVLEGCPEYTLYTINEAASFQDWVEAVARQWLTHIKIVG